MKTNIAKITRQLIDRYEDTVTMYLPKHYWAENIVKDGNVVLLQEKFLTGNWRNEIEMWVSDYFQDKDEVDEDLFGLAQSVSSMMANKYYDDKSDYLYELAFN